MKTTEVLERALEIIPDEEHWVQHAFKDGERHCLSDALEVAADSLHAEEDAKAIVKHTIRTRSGIYTGYSIIVFNDAEKTTYADVRSVLEQSIEWAKDTRWR